MPHNLSGLLVGDNPFGIVLTLFVAVRRPCTDPLPTLRLRLFHRTDFPAGVFGVKIVEQVFERGKIIVAVQAVHAEYNKVYSRRYRAAGKYAEEHSGKDLTEEQFKAWSAAAGQARRDYVEGKISGEEMVAKVSVD